MYVLTLAALFERFLFRRILHVHIGTHSCRREIFNLNALSSASDIRISDQAKQRNLIFISAKQSQNSDQVASKYCLCLCKFDLFYPYLSYHFRSFLFMVCVP